MRSHLSGKPFSLLKVTVPISEAVPLCELLVAAYYRSTSIKFVIGSFRSFLRFVGENEKIFQLILTNLRLCAHFF